MQCGGQFKNLVVYLKDWPTRSRTTSSKHKYDLNLNASKYTFLRIELFMRKYNTENMTKKDLMSLIPNKGYAAVPYVKVKEGADGGSSSVLAV